MVSRSSQISWNILQEKCIVGTLMYKKAFVRTPEVPKGDIFYPVINLCAHAKKISPLRTLGVHINEK